MTTVLRLGEEDVPEVTRVLCEAFYDYPVMRYVLGGHPDDGPLSANLRETRNAQRIRVGRRQRDRGC